MATYLPPGLADRIGLKAYSSDRAAVLTPKMVYTEPKGFGCYKFLIHTNSYLKYFVEKEPVVLKKRHLFPFNPDQAHCAANTSAVPQYFAIFINKTFMQDVATEMLGAQDISFKNDNYRLSPAIRGLLDTFVQESISRQSGYRFILQSTTCQLVVNLFRECKHNLHKRPTHCHTTSNQAIQQAIEFFHANYNKDFSLEDVSQLVSYSSFHFLRLFKQHTGQTPFQFLLNIKLEKAKRLLKETNKSITEICYDSGFNNRSHFYTAFKRKYGVSALQFRKQFLSR